MKKKTKNKKHFLVLVHATVWRKKTDEHSFFLHLYMQKIQLSASICYFA